MRTDGRYVLGIDALPRGSHAAVAVGRTITSTFAVTTDSGQPLPLEERVRAAVEQARSHAGAVPAEVRLVCIDDGADGTELERLQRWLSLELDARMQVLDLVGSIRSDRADEGARSMARACEAALW